MTNEKKSIAVMERLIKADIDNIAAKDRYIAALEQQIDALRKDAERYRWLRRHASEIEATRMIWYAKYAFDIDDETLDAAIDTKLQDQPI